MKKWIPTILILVSIASFFVFIDPQYDQVKLLKIKKEKNSNFLENSKTLEKKRESLRKNFNSIPESDRDHLAKLLPDTVDNVRLILDINNIAETYGIKIQDISVQNRESDSSESVISESFVDETRTQTSSLVGTIELGFSVDATYEVFNEFMGDLEDKLRIVDVKNIDISGAESQGAYTFGITLETYWLR